MPKLPKERLKPRRSGAEAMVVWETLLIYGTWQKLKDCRKH